MALITFLSDFGLADHYVAAVKGKILNHNPNLRIIDISHQIEPGNLAQASFVLSSVFRDFPAGTIHLVAVKSSPRHQEQFLGLEIEDHLFLGSDNGLWGLISQQEATRAVKLNSKSSVISTFAARDVLAPATAALADGKSLTDLGPVVDDYKKMLPRQARASKKQISGHVIHIDQVGNLITNIMESDFSILSKGKEFTIKFGRESLIKVHNSYEMVESGDSFVLFNSLGFLEIGINNGNAAQLLGLEFDSPVIITFGDSSG